ncbi:GroES-like zinc-binding alcohol dehydrogenase family protein [Gossypium australe]|uniref:GroES-like zinc-binding alcohol dehydrogenase family protein n=1 Tax=Gossypium australe TaxID=47621 RepID=A0A5B6VJ64_9ROSI|nr:GroES-like zinc-binding alcohol dehydrogenase family protein [Gossypium australe]
MGGDEVLNMAVDRVLDLNVSWRDKVLGIGSGYSEKELGVMGSEDKDLDFLEGDVMKSTVNGILWINFSNRIKQILAKEMELTLVIKFFYITGLVSCGKWKPSKPFHIMDIGNDYFFVKFQSSEDFDRALTQGSLLGLPGHLYKKKILGEIGGLVGRVAKLNLNTINRTRGKLKKVFYESLPTICFTCGRYGHAKEVCTMAVENRFHGEERGLSEIPLGAGATTMEVFREEALGPWMQVKRKNRRNNRDRQNWKAKNPGRASSVSIFSILNDLIDGEGGKKDLGSDLSTNKGENSRLSLEQNRERMFKDKEGANLLINKRSGKEMGFRLDGPMMESNTTRSGSNALDREKSNKWVGEKPVIPTGPNEEEAAYKMELWNQSNCLGTGVFQIKGSRI